MSPSEESLTGMPPVPEAGTPPLELSIRTKLSVMMFLEYFMWGLWWVTLSTYLLETLQFAGQQVGLAYGTTAVAAMISPFFIGMVADRFFATQRVLSLLYLAGAGILYFVSQAKDFEQMYPPLLAYHLCFIPTLALTNSLSFHHLPDPARQFPGIRVWGTIGWIVAGTIVGWSKLEPTAVPMQIAAGVSIALSIFCLALPHTPPPRRGQRVTWSGILGIDALKLMRERSFAVFVVGSFLICIPLQFYYTLANGFLNELHMTNAATKMTLGQWSEILFMLVMPLCFARLGVKYMLLVGMAAWTTRYLLFSYGDYDSLAWMLYGGIVLHGICYDFFFVTGQIYVDHKASAEIRASAQGLLSFITIGLGGFIGSWLAGLTVDLCKLSTGATDWSRVWLYPAIGAGFVLLVFAAMFRDDGSQPASANH